MVGIIVFRHLTAAVNRNFPVCRIYQKILLLLILFHVSVSWAEDACSLELECDVGGQQWRLKEVMSDGKIGLGTVAGPTLLIEKGRWRLNGEIRHNARYFLWSPRYGVARIPEPELQSEPEKSFAAHVRIHLAPSSNEISTKFKGGFRQFWPTTPFADTAVVCVWIVRGSVVYTQVTPLREGMGEVKVSFDLTADEAHGQPAFLLWSKGSWVAPVPAFSKSLSPDLVTGAMLDDWTSLETEVQANRRLGSEMNVMGGSLLHMVAEAGALRVMRGLVEADPKARPLVALKKTGVMDWAAGNGRHGVVDFLLKHGFKSGADIDGSTPLLRAAASGHTDTVALLVEAGVKIDAETLDHRLPVLAAMDAGYADIVDMLASKSKFRLQPEGPDMVSALTTHVWKGHERMVRWLLAHGVGPNKKDRGLSPLASAAFQGRSTMVKLLLENGADVEQRDVAGNTPLALAVISDHADIVQLLLDAGSDPKTRNASHEKLLHLAAYFDSVDSTALLLRSRAEREMLNMAGYTPLEVALLGQNQGVVNLLVQAGVRLDVRKMNESILEAVLRIDADVLLSLALKDGWVVDPSWWGGWPILNVARQFGAVRCESVLSDAGIKSNSAPDRVVALADLERRPNPVSIVLPQDPRNATERFGDTAMLVELLVDGKGAVRFPKILKSPDPRLSRALLETVRRWRFDPGLTHGIPVATRVKVPVDIPASKTRIFPLTAVETQPRPIEQQKPLYPMVSRLNQENARVAVRFVVSEAGRVTEATVVESSSKACADAAIKAVRRWKYEPATIDGKPVAVEITQMIVFTL